MSTPEQWQAEQVRSYARLEARIEALEKAGTAALATLRKLRYRSIGPDLPDTAIEAMERALERADSEPGRGGNPV